MTVVGGVVCCWLLLLLFRAHSILVVPWCGYCIDGVGGVEHSYIVFVDKRLNVVVAVLVVAPICCCSCVIR